MSFTYYRKFGSPATNRTDSSHVPQAPDPSNPDSSIPQLKPPPVAFPHLTEKPLIPKSALKRRRIERTDDHDDGLPLVFSFTPTHPNHKRWHSKEGYRSTIHPSNQHEVEPVGQVAQRHKGPMTNSLQQRESKPEKMRSKPHGDNSIQSTQFPVKNEVGTANASNRHASYGQKPIKRATISSVSSDRYGYQPSQLAQERPGVDYHHIMPNHPPDIGSPDHPTTDDRRRVRLEEHPSISYWDFAHPHRYEKVVRFMASRRSRKSTQGYREHPTRDDWDPSFTLTLQAVYDRFINIVREKFYPIAPIEPCSDNTLLKQLETKYLRILTLLQREKADLDAVHVKLLQFQQPVMGTTTEHTNLCKNVECEQKDHSNGSKSSSKMANDLEDIAPTVPGNSSCACSANSKDNQNISEQQGGLELPNSEWLTEQQKKILETGDTLLSGSSTAIQLADFVGIETKLNALQLACKQIAFINNSFEYKAASISSAMRRYKIPETPRKSLRVFAENN